MLIMMGAITVKTIKTVAVEIKFSGIELEISLISFFKEESTRFGFYF